MLSDPGFLSGNRLTMRERDEQRALSEARHRAAMNRYRTATVVLVLAMIIIAVPAAAPWAWPVACGGGLLMTGLATAIASRGRPGLAVICLVCAWGVLPGWVHAAPHALTAASELASAIAGHWRASLNSP